MCQAKVLRCGASQDGLRRLTVCQAKNRIMASQEMPDNGFLKIRITASQVNRPVRLCGVNYKGVSGLMVLMEAF